jgi:hypothetical protein
VVKGSKNIKRKNLNTMKNTFLKLTTTLFIILFLTSNQSFAQDPATETLSKDELKLQKLELKVKSIEGKIEATEAKIAYADSLIQAGLEMGNEGSNELKVIESEEKIFVKENNAQRKILLKQLKKADDEDVKGIQAELKAVESDYKSAIKAFDKRYSVEEKKLVKAESNDTKGNDKLKQYNPKLKDYKKALEVAKENLAAFKAEKEL